MNLSELTNLEQELAVDGGHDARKEEVAAAVISVFEAMAGNPPAESTVRQFFSAKNEKLEEMTVGSGSQSGHVLDCTFRTLTQAALWARSDGNASVADARYAAALQVATATNDVFYQKQHNYLNGLPTSDWADKLCIETCYENINAALEGDVDEAKKLIGLGLKQAEKIGDLKRKADFLGKAQYCVFELLESKCPNVALSLGHYLCSSEFQDQLGAPYEALTAWCHYRAGSIFIDLGAEKKKSGNLTGAIVDYEAAKSEYELTLAWAELNQVWYAVMLMYERLGVANNRLGLFEEARASYDKSFAVAKQEGIAQKDVDLNKVRCEIGLGNVKVESASDLNRERMYIEAGRHYFDAFQIANKISYAINKDIALYCIRKLFDEWPGYEKKVPEIKELLKSS